MSGFDPGAFRAGQRRGDGPGTFDVAAWARERARSLVLDAVALEGGMAAITRRERVPGHPEHGTVQEPGPLPGIRAACALLAALERDLRHYACRAREDGHGWQAIGEAMGYADDPQPGMTSVAEHAFARVSRDLGNGPHAAWDCRSCGRLISDGGPEVPLPDAERGHADGCGRFAAAMEAWDAQWQDEGDGSEEGRADG